MFMDIRDVMVDETHAGLTSLEHGLDERVSGFAAMNL